MKMKSLLTTFAAALAITASAGPAKIQGVPYETYAARHNLPIQPLFDIPDTGSELPSSDEFTFDMIENWTGSGENRAALVIQWNDADGRDPAALVFGYRWDGTATGYEMFRDVVLNNPQLFGLLQRTNVGCDISAIAPDGYTVDGIGWDDDESGDPGIWDSANNDYYYPEGGLQYHPRGGSSIDGSYPDYDYDNWKAVDAKDIWQAGWYQGYWSYWVRNSQSQPFSYSGVGVSCRQLVDGCWDGWNFCPGMTSVPWKKFMPAPPAIPADAVTEFNINGLCYRLKNYKNKTVVLCAPFDGSTYSESSLVSLGDGRHTIHSSFVYEDVTYTVVGIDSEAMVGAEINDIVIPDAVTSIGASAFAGSTLSSVSFSDNLAVIGESAFAGCINLAAVTFPKALTEIPAYAFAYSGLQGSLVIPSTVSSILESAFEGCESLTSVELPQSLRLMLAQAFAGCAALTDVKVYATQPLSVEPGIFADVVFTAATLHCPKGFADVYAEADVWKNFTTITDDFLLDVNNGDRFVYQKMPYEITSLEDDNMTVKAKFHHFDGVHRDTAVERANAKFSGDIVIPSQVVYMDKTFRVTEISDSAFYHAKNLTSVAMPADIKGFGKNMFDGCEKLVSCNIPDDVTEISPSCFSNCKALESIVLPAGVSSIGENAFYYCSALKSINLPDGLTSIGERAFYQCAALGNITLPKGVTQIPNYAFSNCESFTQFEFGDQVTSIGTYALSNCKKLASVKLPSTLTALPNSIFDGCSALESVEIPSTVTSIGSYAFRYCPLSNIAIPGQVTKIGSGAFYGCSAMTEAVIPDGVTTIESALFQACTSLSSIRLHDGIIKIGSSAFRGCSKLASISLGNNARSIAVQLPSKITSIESYAFYGCSSITDVVLPPKVTSIGTYAFQNSGLTNITLDDALITISGNCFNSTKLTEVEIPANVKTISANAFLNCPTDIKIFICNPDKLKSLVSYSFRLTSSSPYVYAALTVPVGYASDLSTKSYWKSSVISEPVLAGIDYDLDDPVVSELNSVELSTTISPIYGSELPSRFAAANNAALLPTLTVKALYAPEGSENAPAESLAELSDNKATATITDALPEIRYVYRFATTAEDASTVFTSADASFVTGTTGVADICGDTTDANVTFFDINGRKVNPGTSMLPGVYIRVVSSDGNIVTEKVIIK